MNINVDEEIAKRVKIINDAIKEFLPIREPQGLYKACRHLIDAGGKRIRPVLCLVSAEALGKDWNKILPCAIAIETIHNFTLIHDDIMDEDELRRGVPTVHTLYGVPTAILAGDTLFAEAFKILTRCEVDAENIVKATRILAEVCVNICEGQYLDISFERRDNVSEEKYIEMVKKKTATLIACACSLPAVLFGEDKKIIDALWNFGLLCGIGFQIYDDILDLTGGKKIGKDWGSDLVEGKKTLIIIKAKSMGVEIEILGKGKASKEEIAKAVKKLEECGAIDYASKRAKEFVEKGKDYLKVLPNSEAKELLIAIADYLVSREY